MAIVQAYSSYNSYILKRNLILLHNKYPFLSLQLVGNSVLGKDIFVVKLGNGSKSVFYSGSFHANEWITSMLLMKFIEDYCIAYVNNDNLYGYSIRKIFDSCSIYIMPMVNPDGVDLVTGTLNNSDIYQNVVSIANQYPNIPFPYGWKSNINGVDLEIYQPICKVL